MGWKIQRHYSRMATLVEKTTKPHWFMYNGLWYVWHTRNFPGDNPASITMLTPSGKLNRREES